MTRILLSILTLVLLTSPALAQRDRAEIDEHPCAAHSPYYHAMKPSVGTALADLFFFPGSLVVAAGVGGGPRVEHYNTRTRRTQTVSTAWCMPASLLHHYRGRPQVEPR